MHVRVAIAGIVATLALPPVLTEKNLGSLQVGIKIKFCCY